MRELTAGEVKDIMQFYEKSEGEISIVDMLFVDSPLPALAVAKSAEMSLEDLEKLCPSEIEVKINEAEKLNPFFLRMLERTTALLKPEI